MGPAPLGLTAGRRGQEAGQAASAGKGCRREAGRSAPERGPEDPAAGGWQTHPEITTAWLRADGEAGGVESQRGGWHVLLRDGGFRSCWARAPRGRPCAEEQQAGGLGGGPHRRTEVLKRWPGEPRGPGFTPGGRRPGTAPDTPGKVGSAASVMAGEAARGTGAVLCAVAGPLRRCPHPPAPCTTQSCLGGSRGAGGLHHLAPSPSQLPREPQLCCAGSGGCGRPGQV